MSLVGVLALQGAFAAHAARLSELGHRVRLLRSPRDFDGLEGLVLPGGESSVQLMLIERFDLAQPLHALVRSGVPVLATCAGLILVAKHVASPAQRSFSFLDIDVTRNAYGSQSESFEATADEGLPLVLIRAPRIDRVGATVRVLARLEGQPMLVRENNVTGATFHPELVPLGAAPSIHEDVFGSGRALAAASSDLRSFVDLAVTDGSSAARVLAGKPPRALHRRAIG